MEGLESYRNAVEKLAAESQGKAAKQPHGFTIQSNAADFIGIIMSLPVESSSWQALQDQTTGELFYILGAGGLGSDLLGG